MIDRFIKKINIWQMLLAGAVVLGVVFRFYGLSRNGIFFYDEALYLNHSLPALEFAARQHLNGAADVLKALAMYVQFPLHFTKPIWILVIDSRYFITHWNDWDYAKYASCLFGIATLPLTFVFARRLFNSMAIACLSAAILALLPAHIFYSRLGLQEAFSTLMVLAGFYSYLFPREFGKRTFLAGLFFSMAYLANYRLIILPGLLFMTELWFAMVQKEGWRSRHFIWTCLMFFIVLVGVGSLMGGAQMKYTFAWIFHQQDMAVGKRLWTEIFAYPYYLFRLENWVLAAAFFSSVHFLVRRNWKFAWPFVVVCVQMAIFTLTSDRGARYIAIVLPFVAMASAALIYTVYQDAVHARKNIFLVFLLFIMFVGLSLKAVPLLTAVSDYRPSVEYLLAKDPKVKLLSTQEIVQRLYLDDRRRIVPVPEDHRVLFRQYAAGFRYLILDPQAYISFTANDYKWGLPLKGYMGFIDRRAVPVKTFGHFNRAVMERVVFEHSDDLLQSIRFLDSPEAVRAATLRIYDLGAIVPEMAAFVQRSRKKQ